jgi:5-methyltetrahydropteroyltriglutamate--homocysteine methyltransferase
VGTRRVRGALPTLRNEEAPIQRSEQRILTTHTGSLPHPVELTRLYAARLRGQPVDQASMTTAGKEAVRAVVAKQVAAGVDVINNGEQQRESFVLYLRHRLGGLGGSWQRNVAADLDAYPDFKRAASEQAAARSGPAVTNRDFLPQAVGEIRYLDPRAVNEECDDFAAALAGSAGRYAEAFFTAPSPGIVATIMQNAHYDGLEGYLAAIARALQVEYEAIVAHGFVLQVDGPDLAMERHMAYRDQPLSAFLRFVELTVEAINAALRNVPRDRVRMHVCWGNYEGPHDRDVPLAEILPIIRRLNVGGFVLPFGNARHAHEYRCFERLRLADDQVLVAGVIDTLSNVVEHPEAIAERIERVAAVIGDPRRVLAGTDCGFDTSAGNSRVAPDVAWAKLAALADGARLASARLFGG